MKLFFMYEDCVNMFCVAYHKKFVQKYEWFNRHYKKSTPHRLIKSEGRRQESQERSRGKRSVHKWPSGASSKTKCYM